MQKTTFALAAALLTFGTAAPLSVSYAEEEQVERVEHYHFEQPKDKDAAFTMLSTTMDDITKTMTSEGDLGEAKLEEIHKDSYALEAATDFLRSEGSTDAALVDSLDEAVQALHYASENVEAEQTKEWFGKLGPILEQVYASKQASAPLEKKDFYEIAIKDHAFSPAEIRVPAGEKVKLKVHNQDATPEEFESHDLNREKVIAGGQIATIFVGPLEPGKYHYFGEFNMDSAQGYIIAE